MAVPTTEWTDNDFIYKIFAKTNGLDLFRELLAFKVGSLMNPRIEEYLYLATKCRRQWALYEQVVDLQRELHQDIQGLTMALTQKFDFQIDVQKLTDKQNVALSAGMDILHQYDSYFQQLGSKKQMPIRLAGSEKCLPTGIVADTDFYKQMAPKPVGN